MDGIIVAVITGGFSFVTFLLTRYFTVKDTEKKEHKEEDKRYQQIKEEIEGEKERVEKLEMISIEDFLKVDMRVGTIIEASVNKKAKKPAYKLKIDFGEEIGIKTSSAQITKLYTTDELIGKQIIAVVNFPPRQIADVKSEVLVLGSDSKQGVVILGLTEKVENGDKIC